MGEIEEKLKQILYWQLTFMERDRECVYVDWSQARRGIERHLLPKIVNLVIHLMEEKEETIRKLQAELNQLSFGNDPARDQLILELSKQGLPKTQIARIVGMSRQGLYKAICRLGIGVN